MATNVPSPPPGDWFRALVEAGADVAFSYSPGPPPVLHYVSPSVEAFTGVAASVYLEDVTRFLAMLGEPSRERMAALFAGAEPEERELADIHRPDGSVVWAEARVSVVRDADGRIVRVDGVWHDVTERVLAERRLALESRVLGSIRDAVVAVDADGMITFWNAGAERLFGRPGAEMVGRPLTPLFASVDVTGQEGLLAAIRATEPWNGDIHVRWDDGIDRHLEVMSYPLTDTVLGPARVHIFWDVAEERAASEQLLRFATALDQADDAIYTLDRDGNVLTWNRGAERLTGIPAADAIGKRGPLATPMPEREHDRHLAFAGEKTAWEENVPLRHADGSIIPVTMRSVPVRDDAGNVIALSVFAQDDRPRLESERRHRFQEAILEAIDDAIIVVGRDERVTFWSPSAERMFGVAASDASGRILSEVVGVRVIDGTVAHARHVVDSGEVFRSDVEYTRPDGTTFIGEITVVAIELAEGAHGRLGVVRDVTAVREGAATASRLAALVETAPDMIISADRDGRIISWNAAAQALLGWTADEVIGRTIATYLPADSLPTAWEMRKPILAGEAVAARGELVLVAKDGTRIPVLSSLGPITDAAGNVIAVSAIVQDLRLRKALELQVQQAQKLESASRLARGIAVDYNNLLTAVTGYAHLVETEVDAATPAGDAVARILTAAERGAELTRSLLAFARGGEGEPRVVGVDAVVGNLEPMLRRTVPEHVEVRTDLRSDAFVRVDPTELELVLVNLVTNAAEAMPDGGALVIETSAVDVSPAQAAQRLGIESGDHVRITVADTGAGMTEEIRAHAFEPFYTTKTPREGKGLGLAMAFSYVETAGGSIWIDTEPGRGTIVEVLLPAVPAPAPQPVPAATEPAPVAEAEAEARPAERVLLVEDDALVRALATQVLRRGGFDVVAVADPREADVMDLADIDVVLSDIVMPGLAGPVLGARLRARRPDLRMVFMSGFAEPEVLEEIASLSTQPLLPKPFSPAALLASLRAALDADPVQAPGTEPDPGGTRPADAATAPDEALRSAR